MVTDASAVSSLREGGKSLLGKCAAGNAPSGVS